jgi:hypothetical protein
LEINKIPVTLGFFGTPRCKSLLRHQGFPLNSSFLRKQLRANNLHPAMGALNEMFRAQIQRVMSYKLALVQKYTPPDISPAPALAKSFVDRDYDGTRDLRHTCLDCIQQMGQLWIQDKKSRPPR